MGGGRRARARRGGAVAAALGALGALGALAAARGEGHGFATPDGYAELPDAETCEVGCQSLRMSGKELLEWWREQPEGGKPWYEIANPLQKMADDLGSTHFEEEWAQVADLILKHLADLENKVEADHERQTGVPAAEAPREDKLQRLISAYFEEAPLEYNGDILPGLEEEDHYHYLKARHVNQYHKMTGFLQWPHYDWRPVPREPRESVCKWDSVPVMYISLAARADRRAALAANMPDVPYSIVDAVLGSQIDLSEVGIYQDFKLEEDDLKLGLVPGLLMHFDGMPHPYLELYWNRDVLAGEVGLVLSLKRVFERALGEGRDMVLVLEDDHVVDPRPYCWFLNELADLNASSIEWDFILLESFNWFGDDAANLPEGLSPLFTRVSIAHNTHAILWSAQGIRRVIESGFFEDCVMPVDEYLSYMTNPGRHTRGPDDFHNCLGEGVAPERFLALRWRGPRLVRTLDTAQVSSIDAKPDSEL